MNAACVLITHNGLVLSVSRRDDHTKFGLPGGKVDPGETSIEAAVRELYEETSIKVSPEDLTLIYAEEDSAFFYCECFVVKYLPSFEPKNMPNEGVVAWKEWEDLFNGPFGSYNKRLFDVISKNVI
jgi:8-oxo-dGTP pyrophosphatase MutT (NUDIX family)